MSKSEALSTDLVAALRAIGKGGDGYELTHAEFQTVERAADEIERLTRGHKLEQRRIAYIAKIMDSMGDTDFHETAANIAKNVFLRDDPTEHDYYCAVCVGIDTLIKQSALDVAPEPKPCGHLRSELLAEKTREGEPLFQMRKCLDCSKTFRVRTSVTRGD